MTLTPKTLILIRHAHRDTSQRELDNGLSEKGQRQTRRLVKYFQKRFRHEDWGADEVQFESSPKVRCLETLSPIAQIMGKTVNLEPRLTEQKPQEGFARFQARLQDYLKSWTESSASVTLICGHGDALPLMTYHLLGAAVDFKKAGFLELQWEAGQAHLKQFIPSLKPFFE